MTIDRKQYPITAVGARRFRGASLATLCMAAFLAGCGMAGDPALVTGSIHGSDTPDVSAPALQNFVSDAAWPGLQTALTEAVTEGEDGVRVVWEHAPTQESGTVTPLTPLPDAQVLHRPMPLEQGSGPGDTSLCRTLAVTAQRDGSASEIIGNACPTGPSAWVFEVAPEMPAPGAAPL